MAKVSYGKLQLTKNNEVKTFEFNGQTIEVKQYLPIEEKTKMFEQILNQAIDDNGYFNITKVNFWLELQLIFNYTNLGFTEKQKEDLFKVYDMLKGNKFIRLMKSCMDSEELEEVMTTVWDTIKNIYQQANSAKGIMEALVTDYEGLNFDATSLQEKIADPGNLSLLKDVLTKLG